MPPPPKTPPAHPAAIYCPSCTGLVGEAASHNHTRAPQPAQPAYKAGSHRQPAYKAVGGVLVGLVVVGLALAGCGGGGGGGGGLASGTPSVNTGTLPPDPNTNPGNVTNPGGVGGIGGGGGGGTGVGGGGTTDPDQMGGGNGGGNGGGQPGVLTEEEKMELERQMELEREMRRMTQLTQLGRNVSKVEFGGGNLSMVPFLYEDAGSGQPATGGGNMGKRLIMSEEVKAVEAAAMRYLATPEFQTQYRRGGFNNSNNHLVVHNFHYAYARGWTGNGSLVMVVDTGAKLGFRDLKTNISHYKNFIRSNSPLSADPQTPQAIERGSHHGTGVAGVIAGVKDDYDIHGVAYDAKLAIAKIGDDTGIRAIGENLPRVYDWAKEINATVINHSFSFIDDKREYHRSLVKLDEGSWYSNSSVAQRPIAFVRNAPPPAQFDRPAYSYGKDGFGNAREYARRARDRAGNETVFVFSGGNEFNRPYGYGTRQIATATENGKLILDGRVLIAGWWDTRTNTSLRNKAGNVCVTWDATANGGAGECLDAAKVSDFFILADGEIYTTWGQVSRNIQEDYSTRSGSSFSAPVVSGAVAIIHQMWPHMRGKHIVKLLLDTADNESIPKYEEHVHGQGLLDMKAATNPVGATCIPRAGLINSTAPCMAPAGGGRLLGGVSPRIRAALGEVMLLDTYDRDFYFDLAQTLTPSVTLADPAGWAGSYSGSYGGVAGDAGWVAGYAGLATGGRHNLLAGGGSYPAGAGYGDRVTAGAASPYAPYFAEGQHVLLPPITLGGKTGRDEAATGETTKANSKHQVQFGMGASHGHVLGNRFSGILGSLQHSYTLYGLYGYNYGYGAEGVYGQLGLGVSYGAFDREGSLLAEAEAMVSSAADVGYGWRVGEAGWLRVGVRQRLALERARMRYDVPVGRTLGGAVVREARVVDFATDWGQREVDVGVAWDVPVAGGWLAGFVEGRTLGLDFGGAEVDGRVGVRFGRRF